MSDAASAVRNIIAPWNEACLARDWDALLSMCTGDVVFMPPGAPQVSGAEVRPWLDSFPEIKAMAWDIDDVQEAGDQAFVRGWVKQTLEIDGETVAIDAKYCDLFRREADGHWRFAAVIWNTNDA